MTEEDVRHLRLGQQKLTAVLKECDRICRKHQITYCLTSGTLLGAVLYGGWIPWDGDVDIEILEEDFPRFKALLQAELPPTMWLQSRETDPRYRGGLDKIRELTGHYRHYADHPDAPWHCGLQLDLSRFTVRGNYVFTSDIVQMRQLEYDDVFPLREISFEGLTLFAPNRPLVWLDQQYAPLGVDWRRLPPIAQRHPHEGPIDAERPAPPDRARYPHLYSQGEHGPISPNPACGAP